jgi:3-hydroxybutyrate dehydrogenase
MLLEKRIPEQAKALGIPAQEVIGNATLEETEDGELAATADVAAAALFFASFPSNVLTGQSLVGCPGWFMQ